MSKKISTIERVLNVWAIVLIVWSIYRTKFHLPEWFDEFIMKPIVFIGPIYFYVKRYEKTDFASSIWLNTKKLFSDVYLGIFIGVLFASSALLSNYIKHGTISFGSTLFATDGRTMVFIFAIALATAISEEILSRGFMLKRLYEESKNMYLASFNASVLFFILHIPILFTNARLSGNVLLLFMTTNILLSLANSFIFLERKSLVLPILIHTFYNIALILYV